MVKTTTVNLPIDSKDALAEVILLNQPLSNQVWYPSMPFEETIYRARIVSVGLRNSRLTNFPSFEYSTIKSPKITLSAGFSVAE